MSGDLGVLSHIGNALWVEAGRSEQATVEAITAVSLLDIHGDGFVERVSYALLQQSLAEGASVNCGALNRPFFRLSPEERLVLSALHLGRWSYERLGRVAKRSPEDIAKMAWNARLRLGVSHPHGSAYHGTSCPEYDVYNPWTQRFLDDELSNRERVFLQNHLMACEHCRESLSRCRAFYYQVDALIPRVEPDLGRLRAFERAVERSRKLLGRTEMTFLESLGVFVQRSDVQLILGAVAVFAIVNIIF